MELRILSLAILFGIVAFATGCAALKRDMAEEEELRESITDEASLVAYIKRQGISLIYNGKVSSPEMTAPADEYTVTSGGGLYVFDYPSGADASGALSWVKGNRDLSSPVQMYQKGTLVVVYWGDDPRVERALIRVMGSRTA